MKKISVLVADDHAVVRKGLTALLGTEGDIRVVGTAKNGIEAVTTALASRPDVVIMDLRMPEKNGVEATGEILSALPSTKVLILTSFGESEDVARALRAGAHGVITKSAEDEELVSVIRRIAGGEKYVSPEIQNLMNESPSLPRLSARQLEILEYLAKGLTNRDIADLLGIRKDTVEEHINLLLAKLDAANRTEAVAIALRKQLLKI